MVFPFQERDHLAIITDVSVGCNYERKRLIVLPYVSDKFLRRVRVGFG